MKDNFKILAQFIKDMSSETADIQSYLFVKDNISKYHLDIDISSKPLKNKLIDINTTLRFKDKEPNEKKSHFEIIYASIIKINDGTLISNIFSNDMSIPIYASLNGNINLNIYYYDLRFFLLFYYNHLFL